MLPLPPSGGGGSVTTRRGVEDRPRPLSPLDRPERPPLRSVAGPPPPPGGRGLAHDPSRPLSSASSPPVRAGGVPRTPAGARSGRAALRRSPDRPAPAPGSP